MTWLDPYIAAVVTMMFVAQLVHNHKQQATNLKALTRLHVIQNRLGVVHGWISILRPADYQTAARFGIIEQEAINGESQDQA